MKVVFFSPNFLPLVGGLENVVRDWAYGLTELGYTVQVITFTPNEAADHFPFEVIRCVSQFTMWKLMRKADAVLQFNVSLKGIIPAVLSLRPIVISHHGLNMDIDRKWVRFGRLKQFIADHVPRINLACSNYVASFLRNVKVIHSPYDPKVFNVLPESKRSKDLIFLGRLVSDKGCDVLLQAVAILSTKFNIRPSLTIIGEGPEMHKLKAMALNKLMDKQVNFEGKVKGVELAKRLNNHKVMVVPSVWEEPFGIVALEGLACGCMMVVSQVGGLPEAVGDFGVMFRAGDAESLADTLNHIFQNNKITTPASDAIHAHLSKFTVSFSVNKLALVLDGLK